ncbi:MAG: phosphoenolpyruvate hydrolase family protein [Rhodospirillales bacterium]|nr:phosphoenolpyruvate hydrolase family protein [Rhodospirillales bacterium]
MQIPTAWNRIEVGTGRFTPGVYRTGDVVLPAIRHAPGLSLELSGLMPNRDHNGDLLQAVERMPHCPSGECPVIGILAADPFLRIDQLADRLAEKGYRNLANLPSVTQYGGAFRTILNDLDVGPAREIKVLGEFARLGFAVSVAVAHIDDVSVAFALAPACLFVVPSFDLWRDRTLDPDGLLALCDQVAGRRRQASPATPIVLFAGRMAISPTQARDAGADGILFD